MMFMDAKREMWELNPKTGEWEHLLIRDGSLKMNIDGTFTACRLFVAPTPKPIQCSQILDPNSFE